MLWLHTEHTRGAHANASDVIRTRVLRSYANLAERIHSLSTWKVQTLLLGAASSFIPF